jgi:predicted nuclease of predicted toxin-antitoxin system
MKLLLDENLPVGLDQKLQNVGCNIKRVISGSTDVEVSILAKSEQRTLLTLDKDFANILVYPPRNYFGIICLRIPSPSIEEILKILKVIFKHFNQETIKGKLVIAGPSRFRVR